MVYRFLTLWLLCPAFVFAAQNVVVVLDDSGSMSEMMRSQRGVMKIDAAKQALQKVLNNLPPQAQVGVLALNGDGGNRIQDHWILPLGPIDRQRLAPSVDRLSARGGTPLGEFMKVAADALLQLRDQQFYGDYRLLVVTDGEATDAKLLEAILPDIMSRGILVDVIGVDMGSEHSLATKVHSYRSADDPAALAQAIEAAIAESGDDATAGDADFELLSDFPAELTPAVLATLNQGNNHPITPWGVPDTTDPSTAPAKNGVWLLPLTLGMVCAMGMVVVVGILIVLIKIAKD